MITCTSKSTQDVNITPRVTIFMVLFSYFSSPEPKIQTSSVDHMSSVVYPSVCWSVGEISKQTMLSIVKLNKYGSVKKFQFHPYNNPIRLSRRQNSALKNAGFFGGCFFLHQFNYHFYHTGISISGFILNYMC